MVTRIYFCKNCDHEFETVQPMNEKLKKKCPVCKKNKLAQDLSSGFYGFVKSYNSIGSIAEKNTSDMGTYERESKEQQIKNEDKKTKKQKEEKLASAGLTPMKKDKKSGINIGNTPKHVKKAIAENNQEAVKKYVYEGK